MVTRLSPRAARNAVLGLFFGCAMLVSHVATARDSQPSPNAVPANAVRALPASVDLRPQFEQWGLSPRKQGKRGTCSVFTVVGALEFAIAGQQARGERLSVEFLNWAANQATGQDIDGGMFSDLCRAFEAYGICAEKTMPYAAAFDPEKTPSRDALAEAKSRLAFRLRHHWIKKWNVKTGLTDTQVVEIKRTLSQGRPVCAGFRWPNEPQWSNNVLQMCGAGEVFDGHSVLLVGYRDDSDQPGGGVFVFRNSNNGGHDASMPYDYARAYMNDAVWFTSDAAELRRSK